MARTKYCRQNSRTSDYKRLNYTTSILYNLYYNNLSKYTVKNTVKRRPNLSFSFFYKMTLPKSPLNHMMLVTSKRFQLDGSIVEKLKDQQRSLATSAAESSEMKLGRGDFGLEQDF